LTPKDSKGDLTPKDAPPNILPNEKYIYQKCNFLVVVYVIIKRRNDNKKWVRSQQADRE
jgi:hypothetical protein